MTTDVQNDGLAKRGHEWQVWAGGAIPVQPFRGDTTPHVVTAGVRYGWVLTALHGPGLFRGSFEWAVDALPLVEILQPGRRVYGAGFNPVVWKWNFETRRRLSPYWEFDGGALFSNHAVVPGSTTFNFLPGMAVGLGRPWGKHNWTAEIRFFHISNGGITRYNPGISTIEFRMGFGLFSHRK